MKIFELIKDKSYRKDENEDKLRRAILKHISKYKDSKEMADQMINMAKNNNSDLFIVCMQFVPASVAFNIVKEYDKIDNEIGGEI